MAQDIRNDESRETAGSNKQEIQTESDDWDIPWEYKFLVGIILMILVVAFVNFLFD